MKKTKKTSSTAKSKSKGLMDRVKKEAQKLVEQVENVFGSAPSDIVAAIEADHKSLRNFLGILKDTDKEMGERRRAYKAFSALLKSHTSSEQTAVYKPTMALTGHEMHIKVAEGYVEHQVASDLMKQMEKTKDTLSWSAHANVLSESVEHHLKEEERDLLPMIRKSAPPKLNEAMLSNFLKLRAKSQKKVTEKNSGVLASAKG